MMQAELVWLLAAVAKGDEAAFERLYDATRAKLYGVVLRILGRPELAEEVMQETYLKIWKAAGAFDPTLAVRHLRSCNIDRDGVHSALRTLALRFAPEEAEAVLYQGAIF